MPGATPNPYGSPHENSGITLSFLPSTGGLESAVDGLSRAVQEAGHEVRVVTLRKIWGSDVMLPAECVINGLKVSRIAHWGSRRYPIAPSILSHVNGSDLLHIHAVDCFVDFLSLSKIFHRRPIVLAALTVPSFTRAGYLGSSRRT